jgi:hypothetical protein
MILELKLTTSRSMMKSASFASIVPSLPTATMKQFESLTAATGTPHMAPRPNISLGRSTKQPPFSATWVVVRRAACLP